MIFLQSAANRPRWGSVLIADELPEQLFIENR